MSSLSPTLIAASHCAIHLFLGRSACHWKQRLDTLQVRQSRPLTLGSWATMAGVENWFRDCNSSAIPAATRALLQSHTYAWHEKSKRKNGQHFVLLPIAKKYRRKNGQHFVLEPWNTLASHSTVPMPSGVPLLQLFASCFCPSPALWELRGMGRRMPHTCPSPALCEPQGMGLQEVDEI